MFAIKTRRIMTSTVLCAVAIAIAPTVAAIAYASASLPDTWQYVTIEAGLEYVRDYGLSLTDCVALLPDDNPNGIFAVCRAE